MRHCLVLAGMACLLAVGCANNGLMARKACKEDCRVATSRRAPRPTIMRASCQTGCGNEVNCEECDQACNDGCRGLVDGMAGGFCGNGCNGCDGGNGCPICGCTDGLCPHKHGYPEYTSFNQGPPTGQVAYPYYTTRGPRDYLACHPQSIGPN